MALRRGKKEQLFWGCRAFPYCRATSAYSPEPPLESIITLHEDERRKAQEACEKIAAQRAALARPEAGPDSLSQIATPFSPRPAI